MPVASLGEETRDSCPRNPSVSVGPSMVADGRPLAMDGPVTCRARPRNVETACSVGGLRHRHVTDGFMERRVDRTSRRALPACCE